MIEQADLRLTDWVGGVAGAGVQVALSAPADEHRGAGVSLFLMDLVSLPPMRGQRRAPLQLALRYLVTTWGEDAAAEHRLLGQLVAAAMQEEDFEVVLAPTAPQTWLALGAAPRIGLGHRARRRHLDAGVADRHAAGPQHDPGQRSQRDALHDQRSAHPRRRRLRPCLTRGHLEHEGGATRPT